jgi:hypothetical protein
MRTYRELFAVREFRAIFTAQRLAMASAPAGSLALGTITYASTRNPVLSGLAMFGGPLVRLAASWFLLSASDLLRPRQALAGVAAITCLADLLQAIPGMPWGLRFVILALPWVAMSATGGAGLALVADILPAGSFVFGRASLNIAVGHRAPVQPDGQVRRSIADITPRRTASRPEAGVSRVIQYSV